jgi:hypothetical protein
MPRSPSKSKPENPTFGALAVKVPVSLSAMDPIKARTSSRKSSLPMKQKKSISVDAKKLPIHQRVMVLTTLDPLN